MTRIALRPAEFAPLFGHDLGDVFVLATSLGVRDQLDFRPDGSVEAIEYAWRGADSRAGLLAFFEEIRCQGRTASVLWIADDEFEHYQPEQIASARVAAVSGFSSPLSADTLQRILDIVRGADYERELEIESNFLDLLDGADRILLRSDTHGAEARLDHQAVEHWFSMHGPLAPGQQCVLPTGELSTLEDESGRFDPASGYPLDGEVVVHGQPVVHRGDPGVTVEETAAVYAALSPMAHHPAILEVADGFIQGVRSAGSAPNPFVVALDRLFERDERFRKIQEIGFGTNPCCAEFVAANFFANERYPALHLGIGLGTFTPFHVDLVTPAVDVLFQLSNGRTVNLYQTLGLRRPLVEARS